MSGKSGVILEGRMLKAPPIESVEDATYKRWKRHKFVLTNNALSYESKKKGHVDILANHIVDVYPVPATKGREYLFGVTLSSSPRIFFFETDSDFSRTLWMEKIRSVSPQCVSTKPNHAYRHIDQDTTQKIGVRIPMKRLNGPAKNRRVELVFLPCAILVFNNDIEIPEEVMLINHIRSFGQSNKTLKINMGKSHSKGEGERAFILDTLVDLEPSFQEISKEFKASKQEYVESECGKSRFLSFSSESKPDRPTMYSSIDHNQPVESPRTSTKSNESGGILHYAQLFGDIPLLMQFVAEHSRVTLVDTLDDCIIVTAPFFTAVSRLQSAFESSFPNGRSVVGQFLGQYSRDKVGAVAEAVYTSIDDKPKGRVTSYLALDLSAIQQNEQDDDSKSLTQNSPKPDSPKPNISAYARVNFEATDAICDIAKDTWEHKLGNPSDVDSNCSERVARVMSDRSITIIDSDVEDSEDDATRDRDSRSDSNASSVGSDGPRESSRHSQKKVSAEEDGVTKPSGSLDDDIDDLLAMTDYSPQTSK